MLGVQSGEYKEEGCKDEGFRRRIEEGGFALLRDELLGSEYDAGPLAHHRRL